MKKNVKKEKECFNRMNGIIRKLDSYEAIYPEKEIDANEHLSERDVNAMIPLKDYFKNTDMGKYIEVLSFTEKEIREKGMLSEEGLVRALYARDRLHLLCSLEAMHEHSLKNHCVPVRAFYETQRSSLKTALDKNIRTYCINAAGRGRMQALRTRRKMQLYLAVIEDTLREWEEEEDG